MNSKFFKIPLYLAYNFILVFVLIEIIFRMLPVSNLKLMPVNEKNRIAHYSPNRIAFKQVGSNFKHISKKKINNFGYATDTDFIQDKLNKDKLIAIIGDSYVVAHQVSNQNAFHGIIKKDRNDLSIYPIAVNGAPLSQYLAFADFALDNFNPSTLIFVINENDFDESWDSIKGSPGFYYFTDYGDLKLKHYELSPLKSFLRKSAFIRYLIVDLQIHLQIKIFYENLFTIDQNLEINFKEKENNKIEILGTKAAKIFLKKIDEMSLDKNIIVIVDGDRNSIYSNKFERDKTKLFNSWFEIIIMNLKNHQKIKLIDMHPIFFEDWQKNYIKFNYDYDFHWNEYGHAIVADTLISAINEIN